MEYMEEEVGSVGLLHCVTARLVLSAKICGKISPVCHRKILLDFPTFDWGKMSRQVMC